MKKEQYALISYLLFFIVSICIIFVLYNSSKQTNDPINIILIILFTLLFIALAYVLQRLQQAYTKAKISHDRLYDALASINEAFALFDHNNRLLLWNKQFEHFYPSLKDSLRVGLPYRELMIAANKHGHFKDSKKEDSFNQEINILSNKLEYLADGRCYLSSNNKTSLGNTACISVDITEQLKLEEKILWQANFDTLTSLPNRTLFFDRLSQTIGQAKRDSSICALLFIDLDKFKDVNDTLGHDIGDKLLISVSERLINSVRRIDTVSRLGGDEFTIILNEISSAHDAANIATHIINELEKVFLIEGDEIRIGCSIGITLYPDDADTPKQMLNNADMSMYQAKEAGRNTYRFYTQEMNDEILSRLQLEDDIRQALTNDEFFLEYQPIIDSQSNSVVHAEALIRWQHPVHGRLGPDKFIPLAEESKLIAQLGEWVLRKAIKQAALWHKFGLTPLPISINVSTYQLANGDFVQLVQQLLAETPLPASIITLEITESLLIDNPKLSHSCLNDLKKLGIKLSIDDFGTGYTSLSYLKHFPVDFLKIDKSFVQDITEDSDDAALTSAIINLAHNFNLKVVAEGVETIAQLNFLKQYGCDLIQGFYYSKPLSAKEFLDFCQKQNKK